MVPCVTQHTSLLKPVSAYEHSAATALPRPSRPASFAFVSTRLLAYILLLGLGAAAGESQPVTGASTTLRGYDPEGGSGRTVYEVPIDGTIDLGLAPFVERVVKQAGPRDLIFLRINTFGGRVDAAVRIRDALLTSKATTVAFIDHRAISAGALISLACDTIIMSSGGSIGAATPIELAENGEAKPTSEKVVSYMRAEMRATAEAKGRRADIAEAMVDASLEVQGVNEKGKLVTLTSTQALAFKMADASADTAEAAIGLLNLGRAKCVQNDTDWGEKLARFFTDPMVSSLLMTIGVAALMMEFFVPGHIVPGIVGVLCLITFFFGQYTANLAGWEELLLFGVGFALLLVELLVIPGFGVVGVAGIVAMLVALGMALVNVPLPVGVSYDLGYLQSAASQIAWSLLILMVALGAVAVVFGKYFPKTKLGQRIILGAAETVKDGYGSQHEREKSLLGERGMAASVLRPAGIALLGGKRVDVVTLGDFIEKDTPVEVIQVDGNRVVVRAVTL